MDPRYLLLCILSLITFACHDEGIDPTGPHAQEEGPNPEINASCFVIVTNAAGWPVKDASINLEGIHGNTDAEGLFFFRNVTLKERSTMTIEKAGYFTGVRKFNPEVNEIQFENVVLLSNTEQGTFNNAAGGTVSVKSTSGDEQARLVFPPGAAVLNNGQAYNGQVHVIAQAVIADDPEYPSKLPGNLLAIKSDGQRGLLTSYGFMVVELKSGSGELLNVAPGKDILVTMNLPSSLTQTPPQVSMWYFDESKKYWVEDGQAARINNKYSGNVDHFTFWTFGDWSPYIILDGVVKTFDGNPVPGIPVCITLKDYVIATCGRTNDQGHFSTYLPLNADVKLDVEGNCSTVIQTEHLGPFANDVTMDIVLNQDAELSTLQGTAFNCHEEPLTNGYLRITGKTWYNYFVLTQSNGSFSIPMYDCIGEQGTLRVVDLDTGLASKPVLLTLSPQMDLGNIHVCDDIKEYIRFTVTGFSPEYIYYYPKYDRDVTKTSKSTRIGTLDQIGPNGWMILYANDIVAGYYPHTACTCNVNLPNGEAATVSVLNLTISDYGNVGDFVRGTFDGLINKGNNGNGGSGSSSFTGSFAVIRTY